jgi:hypothetical protein
MLFIAFDLGLLAVNAAFPGTSRHGSENHLMECRMVAQSLGYPPRYQILVD